MGNSASYPPLYRPRITAAVVTAAAEADDADDQPGPLAQAVDETLDAACAAMDAGRTDVAKALLIACQATVDKLLMALGVTDPDEEGE